ncbi:hypothetical protein K1T71_001923 [Dendrolimus kikuchii]|uniref:Uncharacterized protein n=1 Tax=Dendrolimus kikuchii TaxID=765133 RepID=A0ACC1DF09_9NEOP|nr:hypothetical protein K1T71_001923 [Dendrolimus kikuchii]
MYFLINVLKNRVQIIKRHCKDLSIRRNKSCLSLWETDINTEIKLKVEKHWQPEVSMSYKNKASLESLYILPMFPYPSGNLHMGHVRVYSISDAIARFHKLNGYNTVHPIGWDAFGLPAENAAIEHNIPPFEWTKTNISSMKRQLLQLGFNFDWNRELSTCDPEYYKWTQYIFLKLFENGLAYQSKAQVNWDPIDKTVLADEQVDELGCSWRSGAKVEKKYLSQWFLRTTKYAKKLYDGLNSRNLENWKDIINLQKHWIGKCNGILVEFKININNDIKPFDVWTADPYKLVHGDFVLISSTHVLAQEVVSNMENAIVCYNPVSEAKIPVYVSDAIQYPEGKQVYVGCAKFNEGDENLARMLNIPIKRVNDGINVENENHKAIAKATDEKCGGFFVSSTLKDWLISRQRYWGTPIPIIHCPNCGSIPVPYEQLPVELPKLDTSEGGIQTLASVETWVNCKCPKCQLNAKRETDTMDTFVDSSWYYYRFLDPHNENMPFNKDNLIGLAPVDIYIGGKEHAVLHLYYARFMSYFLNSLGWTPTEEPFKKLLVQGMIMGQSYKLKSSGKYIPPENVEKVGKEYKEKETAETLVVQWEKMSKSKYNGENPERLLSTYGCDATRLLILADVPPATARRWSDATLPGVLNWQHRLWMTIRSFLKCREYTSDNSLLTPDQFNEMESKIWESRNFMTATATYHFRHTQKLSVAISRLQSLTNTLRNKIPPEVIAKSKEFELALASLIIMLSPVTPHFCCELWAGFASAPNRVCENSNFIDWNKNVLEQCWPTVDDHYKLSFLCKVDGADVCDLKIKASDLVNLNYEHALQLMLDQEVVQRRLTAGILKTNYELYPGCRAILNIFTNRTQKPVEKEAAQSI